MCGPHFCSMKITQEVRDYAAKEGISDIAALDLAGKGLAIAVNREVVPRQGWDARRLQPRDRVDIVRAIGGG
jgi:sulfur carrier protein